MAPRSVSEIISSLTKDGDNESQIVQNFINAANELYTHPRDEINKSLIHIKDKDIFLIRNQLARNCSDILGQEKLLAANIKVNAENASENLRKRYKADKCYEDLFVLALSIKNQSPHKDLNKVFNQQSTQSQQPNQSQQHVLLTQSESSIIEELHTVQEAMTSLRSENKALKTQHNLVLTKLDNQAKLIEQILKKDNAAANANATSTVSSSSTNNTRNTRNTYATVVSSVPTVNDNITVSVNPISHGGGGQNCPPCDKMSENLKLARAEGPSFWHF